MTDPPEVKPVAERPAGPPLDPSDDRLAGPPIDPRAIRLTTGPATRADDDPTLTVVPDDERLAGTRLDRIGPGRAVLVEASGQQTRLLLGPERGSASGAVVREVVVDGWRIEVSRESERRAELVRRASRGRADAGSSGPSELRAIIPGRIVAVSVAVGDLVEAGQQVLVVEAMKMQNELRAPRAGRVERLAGAVGQNVDVGDLLVVIT